jgi:hypothetical protein
MRTQPIGIVFFVLSSAVLMLGQTPTPTGIQKNGVVGLLRAEGKIPLVPGMPPVDSTTDNATGAFVMSDYTNYTPPTLPPATTIGPCVVSTIMLPQSPQPPSGLVTTFLDGGPFINLNGPNGTKQIPQMKGVYFQQVGGGIAIPTPIPIPGLPGVLPPYLDPGTYTVDNGSGGADVGAFTATLNVPSPGFAWTNADANLTIDRSAGVDIQWTGGDPANNVQIQGTVSTSSISASFTCSVPNNGEFMVTSDVTSLLPASAAGAPAATSSLTVSNLSLTNFSASGLDLGIFSYESGATRFVVYQ